MRSMSGGEWSLSRTERVDDVSPAGQVPSMHRKQGSTDNITDTWISLGRYQNVKKRGNLKVPPWKTHPSDANHLDDLGSSCYVMLQT